MDDLIMFSVFTKPWKDISLEHLAVKVRQMGFDAVEYPLREGYQIQPGDGAKGIRRLVDVFQQEGIAVTSLAGGIDVRDAWGGNAVTGVNEKLFAGCGEAGVTIIRICQGLDPGLGFQENLVQIQKTYDGLLPLCEKYKVTLGVQMHCGINISNSAETLLLLEKYDPRAIAAVWDSGHSGLAGTDPAMALDLIRDQLCMVNFKAAYYRRTNGPEAAEAAWTAYWTTGRHACGSWASAVSWLKKHDYRGIVCLPAEYSDEAHVEAYVREDLTALRTLFAAQ